MTLNQLIEKATELQKAGYGEAEIRLLEDWDEEVVKDLSLYVPSEYEAFTCLGRTFDNESKHVVYIDGD